MSVIKDEYLLVRFSRLLRDEQSFPNVNVVVNADIAVNLEAAARSEAVYGIPIDQNDVTVTANIQL